MTLLEWLRARSPDAIVDLLRARPDLATPPPPDTHVLATRAGNRSSVSRACDRLDAFTLAVLEATVLAGADRAPVSAAALAAWLGVDVPPDRLAAAVTELTRLALLWGSDADGYAIAPTTPDAVGTFPGGLGRPAEDLDGADLTARLAALDEPERRLLHTLATDQPIGHTRDAARPVPIEQARTPVQRLLAEGLLIRRDAETVELPRQVGLAVRGERPLGTVRPDPPPLATRDRDQAGVDATAADAAMTLLREAEAVLAAWSEHPPGVLRSGGLGLRELRKLAKDLDTDEPRAALVAELLVGAGLAGSEEGEAPEWVPTTAADGWLAAPPERRWATLAAAWLELPRLPWLAGQRDERDKPVNPLSPDLHRPLAPRTRRAVLDTAAESRAGTVLDGPDSLVELLHWRHPRHARALRAAVVTRTLAEATALGIVALDGVSTPGRVLLADGADAAVDPMADALPDPVDHVLVQADLTVIAPGPLQPELAAAMSLVGDVESAGGATVYRIGERSVRRALDAGRSAAELHALFRTHSATPVPQGLDYLIDDVARRHGQLRGGVAGSFLRSAEPALLNEVLAHPVAGSLELRRIAEDVVVSPYPLVDVLHELREHGFSPAAEGPEGQLLDLRPAGRRIPARSAQRARERAAAVEAPTEDRLHEVVDGMRAADRAAAVRRGAAVSAMGGHGRSTGLSGTLAVLRAAVDGKDTVWVGIVDSHGRATQHVLTPTGIGGGAVEGADPDTGEVVRLPLHLITTVATVEPD